MSDFGIQAKGSEEGDAEEFLFKSHSFYLMHSVVSFLDLPCNSYRPGWHQEILHSRDNTLSLH